MQFRTPPQRLLLLALVAAALGLIGGGAAYVLIKLIALLTNLALFHRVRRAQLSSSPSSCSCSSSRPAPSSPSWSPRHSQAASTRRSSERARCSPSQPTPTPDSIGSACTPSWGSSPGSWPSSSPRVCSSSRGG